MFFGKLQFLRIEIFSGTSKTGPLNMSVITYLLRCASIGFKEKPPKSRKGFERVASYHWTYSENGGLQKYSRMYVRRSLVHESNELTEELTHIILLASSV